MCQDEETCGEDYFGNKVVNNVPRQNQIILITFIPQNLNLINIRFVSFVLSESWYNHRHYGRKYVESSGIFNGNISWCIFLVTGAFIYLEGQWY